ncbi:MAG TPA: sigma-70 family RNA polymerase sigma factor [Gaiellaceae bacterium]|nr:sigma-70 family RNA polymerase sigma factor [Gaiellaceae bacterium]
MSRESRFEQLVADTSPDLLAFALRRAKSPEDAADVVAETFLIAWRKLDKLPPGAEARLWLFGVARNVLRRTTGRNHLEHDAVERLGRELRQATAPAETEGSVVLRSALARLPEAQREVLLLAAWEELSPREIAAVTGVPVNLVRVRLHRARTRVRRALERPSPVRAGAAYSVANARREPSGRGSVNA